MLLQLMMITTGCRWWSPSHFSQFLQSVRRQQASVKSEKSILINTNPTHHQNLHSNLAELSLSLSLPLTPFRAIPPSVCLSQNLSPFCLSPNSSLSTSCSQPLCICLASPFLSPLACLPLNLPLPSVSPQTSLSLPLFPPPSVSVSPSLPSFSS